MKTSKIIAGLMLAVAVQTAFAAVYECRQNGKVSYSQTPGKHCTNAGLGRDRVYSSVRPAVKDRAEDAGVGDYSDTVRDEHVQNPRENTHKDASNTGAKTH
ncbi:hypothetical protein COH94_02430 [Neisseria meningitidis]|uniref:DUF4124 domain-containing protein n=1 Tax=Neisseria meningitidis TaxID=487 RepID=UPI000F44BA9E|nr:DUF4124 domain-containing protein [Neisseria meningitidis]RNJ97572.1 hypothetical protein COI36_06855 [Neisseria meningitidis]RNK37556.1 hypothetical protein COH88_03720 [Neisseria meningitidis]RNL17535.1 hypothetical protein COH85_01895 [Neisseria meningitidis]RQJ66836.1 hypothetical protein COI15_02865 [Neisseria meningitidis]RQK07468.1 hypothetical protein COH94_02430 [Neisseria meningitidis]